VLRKKKKNERNIEANIAAIIPNTIESKLVDPVASAICFNKLFSKELLGLKVLNIL
jgi:hypothetical protein